ncbi:hypothetical protein HOLleu_21324 [Holothuria leucospilota]|uniref:Uncharacterized protein n=1 Tax=Holothuria leucospilota TaxID=206669 RepID=A0A9Q1H6Q9_HOLLE|nr:hypothetical protein HOLleu_21324 [Holothuria leucospilota]
MDKEWENKTPQHRVPNEALNIKNYYIFWWDRQFSAYGGRLITSISKDWTICNPKICSTISTPDIQLFAVSARPRFLPSEFSNITIINVYIRPSANFAKPDQILKCTVTNLQKETIFLRLGM